jgi:hypothetical protein
VAWQEATEAERAEGAADLLIVAREVVYQP